MVSKEKFLSVFPAFSGDRTALLDRLLTSGVPKRFEAGDSLYLEGDRCPGIGFLMVGEIRVYKIGENGREITLYEIFAGETCMLNASCLLSRRPYPAHAMGISDGYMLYIPDDLFLESMAASEVMRKFIFSLFSQRFTDVIELIEEVTFGNLSERLTEYLVEKSSGGLLSTSHQHIANELGSSREVISRLLKDFERQGKVGLSRNLVKLMRL